MFAIGGLALLHWKMAIGSTIVAAIGLAGLLKMRPPPEAPEVAAAAG